MPSTTKPRGPMLGLLAMFGAAGTKPMAGTNYERQAAKDRRWMADAERAKANAEVRAGFEIARKT